VNLLVEQVELADVLVLNKTDLVTKRSSAASRASCAPEPRRPPGPRTRGQVPLDAVINTGLFDMEKASASPGWAKELAGEHIPESEQYGIRSFVYNARRPFHPAALKKQLERCLLTDAELKRGPLAGLTCPTRSRNGWWSSRRKRRLREPDALDARPHHATTAVVASACCARRHAR
jgi:G3E family GTPase